MTALPVYPFGIGQGDEGHLKMNYVQYGGTYMQAIMETAFDAVYLITVITTGVILVQRSKGRRQTLLFGLMAILLGAGAVSYTHLDVYKRQVTDRSSTYS